MASVYNFEGDVGEIITLEIVRKGKEIVEREHLARKYFRKAKLIQSVWRSYKVRKTIQKWHDAATTIQKHFRGWLVRWKFLASKMKVLSMYGEQAAKIQGAFKIAQSKRIANEKRDIKLTESLIKSSNMSIKTILGKAKAKANLDEKLRNEQKIKMSVVKVLSNCHHLLRTEIKEGVLSDHGSQKNSLLEEILKNVKYAPKRECYGSYCHRKLPTNDNLEKVLKNYTNI